VCASPAALEITKIQPDPLEWKHIQRHSDEFNNILADHELLVACYLLTVSNASLINSHSAITS